MPLNNEWRLFLTPVNTAFLKRKRTAGAWNQAFEISHFKENSLKIQFSISISLQSFSAWKWKLLNSKGSNIVFVCERCICPSRKAAYSSGLPQSCGIKVVCASVVFCGLPDHVKQSMTCSLFRIWEILLCNLVPGRAHSWGRGIWGPKDADSKWTFQRVVNGQENQGFTEARQTGMSNLFFWLMVSRMPWIKRK